MVLSPFLSPSLISLSLSQGPLGDFHVRRSRQLHALLLQSLQTRVMSLLTHDLGELPTYQRLHQEWRELERRARIGKGAAAAAAATNTNANVTNFANIASTELEIVPRVEAQKVVQEWIELQGKK